jgi:hypothetical protein
VGDYPINSEELTRRLLGHQREPEYGKVLQEDVRPLLRRFGCAKSGTTRQARWIIDEAMAQRGSVALGLPIAVPAQKSRVWQEAKASEARFVTEIPPPGRHNVWLERLRPLVSNPAKPSATLQGSSGEN